MKHYEMGYCWLDILCMPQDKQDEIDQEVGFMGDYYAGADYMLVLPTTSPKRLFDIKTMTTYQEMDM